MKRYALTAALLFGTLVACGDAAFPTAKVPVTFASEKQDAWLHEHCLLVEVTPVAVKGTLDELLQKNGGNFVELLELTESTAAAKIFKCGAKPTWYASNQKKPIADDRQ